MVIGQVFLVNHNIMIYFIINYQRGENRDCTNFSLLMYLCMFKIIFGKVMKEKRKKKVLKAIGNHETVIQSIFKPIQMITTFCRNSKFQSLDQVVKNRN